MCSSLLLCTFISIFLIRFLGQNISFTYKLSRTHYQVTCSSHSFFPLLLFKPAWRSAMHPLLSTPTRNSKSLMALASPKPTATPNNSKISAPARRNRAWIFSSTLQPARAYPSSETRSAAMLPTPSRAPTPTIPRSNLFSISMATMMVRYGSANRP